MSVLSCGVCVQPTNHGDDANLQEDKSTGKPPKRARADNQTEEDNAEGSNDRSDPFGAVLEESTQKETEASIVLPGVPCVQQEEIQAMYEQGYMSKMEAANAVRSMLGMSLLTEEVVKKQQAQFDKEMCAREKALAAARAPPEPKTPPGGQPAAPTSKPSSAPGKQDNQIVLEVKTSSTQKLPEKPKMPNA